MKIPQTELTAEQVQAYLQAAKEAIVKWGRLKTTNSVSEMEAYQDEISNAAHGIETIEDYLENELNEWKKKLGAIELLKKDLRNHAEMAKRKFWAIRRDEPDAL